MGSEKHRISSAMKIHDKKLNRKIFKKVLFWDAKKGYIQKRTAGLSLYSLKIESADL